MSCSASKEQGLEGILAKRLDSAYLPGKSSPSWTKVKNVLMQEVVVGGFTPGEGSRRGRLGSLLLGIPSEEGLCTWAGGHGLLRRRTPGRPRGQARRRCGRTPTRSPPTSRLATPRSATWVEPTLVGEVTFSEWTNDGRLRHPSWRGLREDKDPGRSAVSPDGSRVTVSVGTASCSFRIWRSRSSRRDSPSGTCSTTTPGSHRRCSRT